MGSSTPPFFNVPVWVYNWMEGSSTSCMHKLCCFCSYHICWIDVLFSRGILMVSFPLSEENESIRSSMRRVVSSTPRMRRLQWKANSFLVICIATSSFRFLHTPLAESWPLLAAYNLWRSLLSYSNTHADRRDIKVACRAWDSEQQPAANRLIKCHTSRRMTRLLNSWKWLFNFVEQQSRSTYRSFGGGTLDFLYLSTKPVTMSPRPSPSESVKTDESTWPCSLPTFLAQEAVPAVFPPSFLVTCKIVQEERFLKHFDKYNTAMHTQKMKVPKIC